jgi:hypothetical protein
VHYILIFLKGMDQIWFKSVVYKSLNYKCSEDKGTISNTRQKDDVSSQVTDFFVISQFRSQRSTLLASWRSHIRSHLKILSVRVGNEIPCWGSRGIRSHHTKFRRQGDLASGIYAPLLTTFNLTYFVTFVGPFAQKFGLKIVKVF